MFPKRFAVAPIGRLFPSTGAEKQHDKYCRRHENFPSQDRCSRGVGNRPRHREIQSDCRQIRVAIGVALQTDFHNADDWQQHHEIPKPADKEIRTLPPKKKNEQCNRQKKRRAACHLPKCEMIFRMRIKHREIRRPDRLPDVGDVTDKRVLESPAER